MKDDTFHRSEPERVARAIAESAPASLVIDAIAGDPDRIEAGWLLLGRDVDLGEGHRIDLLAMDGERRLVVVVASNDPPTARIAEAFECGRRIEARTPLLRQVVASIARPGVGPIERRRPRLIFLTGDDPRDVVHLTSPKGPFPLELFRYRLLRVGDRYALHFEPIAPIAPTSPTAREEGGATPEAGTADRTRVRGSLAPPIGSDSEEETAPAPLDTPDAPYGRDATDRRDATDARKQRLLADARTRILNLSAEITTLEANGGLVFRYRGTELARFEDGGDGLLLMHPAAPEGRRILGRSDLEEGLHGVIESFFALYSHGPRASHAAAGAYRAGAGGPSASRPSRPGPEREPSVRPMPGPLPLTPEELNAFLDEDELRP